MEWNRKCMLQCTSEQNPTGVIDKLVNGSSYGPARSYLFSSFFARHNTKAKICDNQYDTAESKPFERTQEFKKTTQTHCHYSVDNILFLHTIKRIVTKDSKHSPLCAIRRERAPPYRLIARLVSSTLLPQVVTATLVC